MLQPEMYVLVKFQIKSFEQHYVGKIISIEKDENQVEVKFMRHSRKVNYKFHWPDIEDQAFIPAAEITKILPEPTHDRRGCKIFPQKYLQSFKKTLK